MTPLPTYTLKIRLSSIIMIAALVWLTVSLPFVTGVQLQESMKTAMAGPEGAMGNEDASPFANTTEEKAPSTTVSEEYLHTNKEDSFFTNNILNEYCSHSYDIYVAFHGELISPPPDPFLS